MYLLPWVWATTCAHVWGTKVDTDVLTVLSFISKTRSLSPFTLELTERFHYLACERESSRDSHLPSPGFADVYCHTRLCTQGWVLRLPGRHFTKWSPPQLSGWFEEWVYLFKKMRVSSLNFINKLLPLHPYQELTPKMLNKNDSKLFHVNLFEEWLSNLPDYTPQQTFYITTQETFVSNKPKRSHTSTHSYCVGTFHYFSVS